MVKINKNLETASPMFLDDLKKQIKHWNALAKTADMLDKFISTTSASDLQFIICGEDIVPCWTGDNADWYLCDGKDKSKIVTLDDIDKRLAGRTVQNRDVLVYFFEESNWKLVATGKHMFEI